MLNQSVIASAVPTVIDTPTVLYIIFG